MLAYDSLLPHFLLHHIFLDCKGRDWLCFYSKKATLEAFPAEEQGKNNNASNDGILLYIPANLKKGRGERDRKTKTYSKLSVETPRDTPDANLMKKT